MYSIHELREWIFARQDVHLPHQSLAKRVFTPADHVVEDAAGWEDVHSSSLEREKWGRWDVQREGKTHMQFGRNVRDSPVCCQECSAASRERSSLRCPVCPSTTRSCSDHPGSFCTDQSRKWELGLSPVRRERRAGYFEASGPDGLDEGWSWVEKGEEHRGHLFCFYWLQIQNWHSCLRQVNSRLFIPPETTFYDQLYNKQK